MSKLPRVSGRDLVAVLLKKHFVVRRQHGSHIVLRRDDPFAQVVVPDHREHAPMPSASEGTLRAILLQAGVSIEEFADLI